MFVSAQEQSTRGRFFPFSLVATVVRCGVILGALLFSPRAQAQGYWVQSYSYGNGYSEIYVPQNPYTGFVPRGGPVWAGPYFWPLSASYSLLPPPPCYGTQYPLNGLYGAAGGLYVDTGGYPW
jgi:hypothetical protein